MKKVFVILIALATTMVACNKVADVNDPMDSVKDIVFNMDVKQGDVQDTKAVKTDWENGDKVYVFFKGLVGTNKYAIFTYDGSSWTKNANGIIASDLSGLAEKQLTAVYFPFGTPTFTANGDKYDVTADESYYLCINTTYTSAVVDESLVLSATLNMTVPAGFVQFSMPNTDGKNTFFHETPAYTLTESHLAPVSVTSITPGSAPTQAVESYGNPLTGYFYGDSNSIAYCILFSGILNDEARGIPTTYNFTFVNKKTTTTDYDDVTYYFKNVNATLYQGDGASWRALKFPVISSNRWTVEVPGTVTVGGVQWATFNIGATSPAGYGDYFSWGAVYPQKNNHKNYYTEKDISNDLDIVQDHNVAVQKLGNSWRMPKHADYSLLDKNTHEWVDDYNSTGVSGWLINADDYETTGAQLFLPAPGQRTSTTISSLNSRGFYWSAKWVSDSEAVSFSFMPSIKTISSGNTTRSFGRAVRPVYDPAE